MLADDRQPVAMTQKRAATVGGCRCRSHAAQRGVAPRRLPSMSSRTACVTRVSNAKCRRRSKRSVATWLSVAQDLGLAGIALASTPSPAGRVALGRTGRSTPCSRQVAPRAGVAVSSATRKVASVLDAALMPAAAEAEGYAVKPPGSGYGAHSEVVVLVWMAMRPMATGRRQFVGGHEQGRMATCRAPEVTVRPVRDAHERRTVGMQLWRPSFHYRCRSMAAEFGQDFSAPCCGAVGGVRPGVPTARRRALGRKRMRVGRPVRSGCRP